MNRGATPFSVREVPYRGRYGCTHHDRAAAASWDITGTLCYRHYVEAKLHEIPYISRRYLTLLSRRGRLFVASQERSKERGLCRSQPRRYRDLGPIIDRPAQAEWRHFSDNNCGLTDCWGGTSALWCLQSVTGMASRFTPQDTKDGRPGYHKP